MQSYPTAPTGGRGTAPQPGAESPAALRATAARLRAELADAVTAQRAAEARASLAEAEGNAARNALAAVRAVLVRYLGGDGATPANATVADLAEALGQDVRYARRTAQQMHSRRRITEAITERQHVVIEHLEAEVSELRGLLAGERLGGLALTPMAVAALDPHGAVATPSPHGNATLPSESATIAPAKAPEKLGIFAETCDNGAIPRASVDPHTEENDSEARGPAGDRPPARTARQQVR